MCKKLIFLISFVLVFGLVSNTSAVDVAWNDGDPCDHRWDSPLNWSDGMLPSCGSCDDNGNCYEIYGGYGLVSGPFVDANVTFSNGGHVMTIIVGAYAKNTADGMTMVGGHLTTDWEYTLALNQTTTGTLNMSGGLIEPGELFVGVAGTGYLNMTDPCGTGGGTIDVNEGPLAMPGTVDWSVKGNGEGTGFLNLDAGTIICGSVFMGEGSLMDVNGGMLIVHGDARATIAQYADQGKITGAGSSDPRNVGIVYDDVNDLTIVTYDPIPDLTLAWKPSPGIGVTGVHWKPTLSWEPGCYAQKHTVYFGSSLSDVNESATPVSVNQPGTTYPIGSFLDFGQAYYWRIDEVNDACAPYLWPGAVWSFTVGEYVSVDDFDSYPDHPDLRAVWHDTWTGGYRAEVFVEKGTLDANLVRDGNSMLYDYDNDLGGGGTKNRYSEAWANTADLEIGQDWTGSAKALVLYFYGQPGNAADPVKDRMWVVLSDDTNEGMVKYDGDMNDIKKEEWQDWNINLQDPCLSAVDNNNVTKVYIGFGVRAGTGSGQEGGLGTVYFDDIRLYPARCVAQFAPAGDITGECLVDYADVDALAGDWLLSDYNIVATAPSGPVGWWKLDEGEGTTAVDSAGTNNGTHGGSFPLTWVADCGDPCRSPCLDFDGVGHVNVPPAAFTNVNDEITVTLWQYGTMTPADVAHVMFHAHDACDPYDLTVKCELYWPSATGCEVFFDAGYGGEASADSVTGWANPDDYSGQWNHYAYTKNANTGEMKIYLNGVLFADQGEDILVSPVTGTEITLFKLGSDADDTRRYTGRLSDVRLYNYVLSYGEVRYVAGMMDVLYVPLPNPEVDLLEDGKVNFKDYAVLANTWLVETFWP